MEIKKQPTFADAICNTRSRKIKRTFFNPNIHKRRSIRLDGYDYSQEGLYFITLCCQDRAHLFGEIIIGVMRLNAFGEIAQKEWNNTPYIRKNIGLHEFIIMPNHIHGIIEVKEKYRGKSVSSLSEEIGKFRSPSQTIGSIIRGYKIATIKKIKEKINNSSSTGELQFAPTPTAPTEKILQLDFKIYGRIAIRPNRIPLKADKGYQSKKNSDLLKARNLKNHILKKAYRHKPLTEWEKKFNKAISKTRFKVERTFGSIKRWFSGGIARYRGIEKMHTQNLLEAMSYNLYRVPEIIASNSKN